MMMALKGFNVTMYEGNDQIGGVLRYGIPDFRLDKTILDKIETNLKKLGVKIRKNIMIGKNITLDDLQVGDEIILTIRSSEIENLQKEDDNKAKIAVEQLQLGTQRIK